MKAKRAQTPLDLLLADLSARMKLLQKHLRNRPSEDSDETYRELYALVYALFESTAESMQVLQEEWVGVAPDIDEMLFTEDMVGDYIN